MAHQTFEEIRDEALKRMGRSGVTALTARVEKLVDASYREVCQTWHHHQLDKESSGLTSSVGSDTVALPADCYLVFGVRLFSGSTFKGRLGYMRTIDLLGQQSTTNGLPTRYTRFASNLVFDRPADAAYSVEVFYYARPADPVFTGAPAPVIDELFDEILVEWTVARGQGMLWRPDLGAAGLQSLAEFWNRVANPPLRSGIQRDRDEGDVSDTPYGEALG